MSDTAAPNEDSELKGGHPPAVKVGGMRVATKTHTGGSTGQSGEMSVADEEEFGSGDSKPDKHHQSIIVSGAVTKGDKDFPAAAVKAYHDKPVAAIDRHAPPRQNMCIQQPRK